VNLFDYTQGQLLMQLFTLSIILFTAYFTYKGLNEYEFKHQYLFHIDGILIRKEYIRLISSGFLHLDWNHFAFNMLTLYFFGNGLEQELGISTYISFYFLSLLGGNLLALYFHRQHGDYSALGASGAVSGIIFACISLYPDMWIRVFFIFPMPAWIYGIAYTLYTLYGIISQKDNIGHEAHFGGALVGIILSIIVYPEIIRYNLLTVVLILVPIGVFFYIILKKPHLLIIGNVFGGGGSRSGWKSVDDKYNENKKKKQEELDVLLDKISRKGIEGLSTKERNRLHQLTKD